MKMTTLQAGDATRSGGGEGDGSFTFVDWQQRMG